MSGDESKASLGVIPYQMIHIPTLTYAHAEDKSNLGVEAKATITACYCLCRACSSSGLLPPFPRDEPDLRRCDTSLVHGR